MISGNSRVNFNQNSRIVDGLSMELGWVRILYVVYRMLYFGLRGKVKFAKLDKQRGMADNHSL